MNTSGQATCNEPIIIVENVSKRFTQNEYRLSLRHEAVSMMRGWLRQKQAPTPPSEQFWALRNVNFKVYAGESVGIIGQNGAGKSTLFRVICNITEPTTGSVTVKGHFAPLIALGTGFNSELTGEQNIYMSAAIHGLSIKQIDAIMPKIVEFSELQEFMGLPVKRYSSGMVARLGFSVAIFTLPDIIFLDEILAVGDASFQIKCKEVIQDFIAQNRTMLFVSHATSEVRRLCKRAIWMQHGEIVMDGPSNDVIDNYEAAVGVPNTRTA